jgi:hypothetical protein
MNYEGKSVTPSKRQVGMRNIRGGPGTPSPKRDSIATHAKNVNWEKFDRVMTKVRDVAPLPGDENI